MAKSGILELDGEVIEVLPAGRFKVKLKEMDSAMLCYKAGKMKQSRISVIEGDTVRVEVNLYAPDKGRITYRYNPVNHHADDIEGN